MCNYLINFRPGLLGAPLQLGALSARLVRLWVNPVLKVTTKSDANSHIQYTLALMYAKNGVNIFGRFLDIREM